MAQDSDEIIYHFPQLLAAADHCQTAIKQVNGEHDSLSGRVKALAASWDGDAKNAYHRRQTEWDKATTDMVALLGQIEKALRESAAKMQQREKANTAKFDH